MRTVVALVATAPILLVQDREQEVAPAPARPQEQSPEELWAP
jgi:hypothetical protein